MAGMAETSNHVAAAMYCVEAVVQIGLIDLVVQAMQMSGCQSKSYWTEKDKDLDFSRKNFGH